MKGIVKRNEIVTTEQVPEQVSGQCDIEFVFTNTSSKAWKTNRLLIQRRADAFAYSPDKTVAYAGFKLNPKTAIKILGVYLRIYNWKSLFIKVRGTDVELPEEANKWMHCLLLAFASGTPETYCAIEDYDPALHTDQDMWLAHVLSPETFRDDNITIPCRNVQWRPDLRYPAKYKESYMRAARASGCDRCPLFNAGRFCGNLTKKITKK